MAWEPQLGKIFATTSIDKNFSLFDPRIKIDPILVFFLIFKI